MRVAWGAAVGRWVTLIRTATLIHTLTPTRTRTPTKRAPRLPRLVTSATRSTPFTSKLFLQVRRLGRTNTGTNLGTNMDTVILMIMATAGTCRRSWR